MCTLRISTAFAVLVASLAVFADDADAQGLLRRLRERISPVLQRPPATEDSADRLPARPIDGQNNADGDSDRSATGSRTNAPTRGLTRVAPIGANGEPDDSRSTPTPNQARDGASTASGSAAPAGERLRELAGRFGGSILSSGNSDPAATTDSQQPASIGIKAVAANPGYPAVQVTEIAAHSRAAEAGLKIGDYVFAIDGTPTSTVRALATQVAKYQPGETVTLRVGQAGQVRDLSVPLVVRGGRSQSVDRDARGSRPLQALADRFSALPKPESQPSDFEPLPQPDIRPSDDRKPFEDLNEPAARQPKLGATVQNIQGRRGVEVQAVQPGSIAERVGMKVGDRIVAVDGQVVIDQTQLSKFVSGNDGDTIELRMIRNGQLVDTTVDFAAQSSGGSDTDAAGSGASVVSGIGSVLGTMFGGGSKPAQSAPAPTDPPSTEDDNSPAMPKSKPGVEAKPDPENPFAPAAQATPASETDPAAAKTEDAGQDVVPEAASGLLPPLKDLLALDRIGMPDPKPSPTTEETLPAPSNDQAAEKKANADIRAQIERLRREIKQLESQLER